MKKINITVFVLLITTALWAQHSVTGNFSAHSNVEIRLKGFNGFTEQVFSQDTISVEGNFSLPYPHSYTGMAGIEIKDQGIGIPKEEQKQLFERFFRARNTYNIEGTGIGLNIVKQYVELMNGTIDFESQMNNGSTFKVKWPKPNEK